MGGMYRGRKEGGCSLDRDQPPTPSATPMAFSRTKYASSPTCTARSRPSVTRLGEGPQRGEGVGAEEEEEERFGMPYAPTSKW